MYLLLYRHLCATAIVPYLYLILMNPVLIHTAGNPELTARMGLTIASASTSTATLTAVTSFNEHRNRLTKEQPGGTEDATSTPKLSLLPITRSSLHVSVGVKSHGGYIFL